MKHIVLLITLKTPLPDDLATLDVGMKHLVWRGGMNEAVLKAQTNECRGGGVRYL